MGFSCFWVIVYTYAQVDVCNIYYLHEFRNLSKDLCLPVKSNCNNFRWGVIFYVSVLAAPHVILLNYVLSSEHNKALRNLSTFYVPMELKFSE